MASSSVSQESLDKDDFDHDFDYCARRSRIRTLRARGALHRSGDREAGDSCERDTHQNGERTENGPTGVIQDHDSPTRSAGCRAKNTRNRPNHLHKGKLPKDKRKLREKRRSTGVLHLASTTESTGDSLDDDDAEEKTLSETKRNTTYNEVIDADNPQTPADDQIPKGFSSRRNKSPSDLEADLEDNQDYDSTVSQSETNLTLIGQSDSTEPSTVKFGSERNSVLSRYSPTEPASRSFKPFSSNKSDNDSRTPNSSTSSSSSVLSRYRETELPKQDFQESTKTVKTGFTSRYIDKKLDNDSSFSPRYRYRDRFNHVGSSSLFQSAQPARDEEKEKLEKLLEKEREENKRLQSLIEEKDKKISELEREVTLMNKEMDELDEENEKLRVDNSALIRALSQLSTRV